ncbi:hypothetical protein LZ24_02908 [Desulfobotulus alkaliphilus]|uniref:Polymerase nucleotidyl transferase domain-containing protein n=1 Tax=Desulfobotulus alkaliphilus TaxID=622671 RepID=A0A562RAH6_9BACT|nr:nucleotidyltransferase family protein [Desulfobotulus alkaliphilus]TWI66058.1 hypothetical protein LZ24_02908 [Desulfobotulus alkaliphilus]
MDTSHLLKNKREEILRISRQHGAKNIRVFGSVARNQDGPDSDIDILVDLDQGRSLMDLGGMSIELETLLGQKVDIVTEKGLHWYLKEKIIREARPL